MECQASGQGEHFRQNGKNRSQSYKNASKEHSRWRDQSFCWEKLERGLCAPRIGNQFFRNEEAGKTTCEESSKL